MKAILCFGDSNTWGYIPGTDGDRFPYSARTAGILQARLGAGYRVLEEGLCGRMSAWEDPMNPDRNASRQLPAILEVQRPLDLVSIMLGTNDLKAEMKLDARDCARAQAGLIDIIEKAACGPAGARPAILLIAPPLVVETPTPFGNTFDGAIPKSLALADAYRKVALERGCLFLDAGSLVATSIKDGIHLDEKAHQRMAEAIAESVLRLIPQGPSSFAMEAVDAVR